MDLLYILENLRMPWLDSVMSAVTNLGGETVFMALAMLVFWCVSKNLGYYMLTVGFSGTLVNQFLKIVCRIPRPWVLDPDFTIVESARAEATGYSFPSGHTQTVLATLGCPARWSKRAPVRWLCAAGIVLTAFSRMYLGVHTPADVGVSLLIGLVLVFALYPVFMDAEGRPGRMYAVLGVMLALSGAYCAFVSLHVWPADIDGENLASAVKNGWTMLGAVAGMLLAFFLDTRYVRFSTAAPLWGQAVKTVLGLGLAVGIKAALKAPLLALFGGHPAAHAVRYFLLVLFAAVLWPMTFRLFSPRKKR